MQEVLGENFPEQPPLMRRPAPDENRCRRRTGRQAPWVSILGSNLSCNALVSLLVYEDLLLLQV